MISQRYYPDVELVSRLGPYKAYDGVCIVVAIQYTRLCTVFNAIAYVPI